MWSRQRREQELDDELRAHLAMETRRRVELGESPEAARQAALKDLGSRALVALDRADYVLSVEKPSATRCCLSSDDTVTTVRGAWERIRFAVRRFADGPASERRPCSVNTILSCGDQSLAIDA